MAGTTVKRAPGARRTGVRVRAAASRRALTRVRTAAPERREGAVGPVVASGARLRGLDALRGVAILAMIAYHFCFDLRWFGLARFDFEQDPRWIAARSVILGSFLFIAGISLVLLLQRPDAPRRFARQVSRIVAAALLVTLASYLAFPQRYIWFGVLHAIAVALLVAYPLARHPRIAAVIGIAIVAAGLLIAHPVFDAPALAWIGFMTHKPATEDYVPLFPWAGLVLLGTAAGHALLRTHGRLLAPLERWPRLLAVLGRHSLLVYLVHQPLLIALLWLATHR